VTAAARILALAGLVLAAAACSSGSPGGASAAPSPAAGAAAASQPAATATPSPPPTTAAPTLPPSPPPVAATATDLTFTGGLAGRVQSATSAGVCGRAAAGFAAELHFTIANQAGELSIALLDYHGPGSYGIPPERVFVQTGSPPNGQFLPAVRGTLTVDGGERSGRIVAALGDGGTQVTGTWICT
jgi:hypothetical protein